MGVFELSKSFYKVVHDISLMLALPSSVASFSPLLLAQRGASLHGHKRRAERLEPRRDTTQRLAFSSLLLVFSRT
jgi:hypothetical protein